MLALSTKNLNNILWNSKVTGRYFLGTFPACMHPKTKKSIYAFITNTDVHYDSGEHWNAWYVRDDRLYFFDSFGRSPLDSAFPDFYHKLAHTYKSVTYSRVQIQATGTSSCGYFCIHFIYILALGLGIKNFIDDYFKVLYLNEYKVLDFINSIV